MGISLEPTSAPARGGGSKQATNMRGTWEEWLKNVLVDDEIS